MDPVITIRSDADRERVARWSSKAPAGTRVVFKKPRRTVEQNSLLWPILNDISRQLDWYGEKLSPDEVKDLLSAALRKSRVVPAIDSGFVILGQHTSSMTKKEFSELIELAYAFGAQHGVKFNEQ